MLASFHAQLHRRLVRRIARGLCAAIAACAIPVLGAEAPITLAPGPFLSIWSPTTRDAGYGFAGWIDRTADGSEPFHSVLTVGAQFGAVNQAGVHQLVFGAAAEAWAMEGSLSMLTGLEASVINLESRNAYRKIGLWSTFKNRPDGEYDNPRPMPANTNSQALRVEAQPGTGFERGIVFATHSLFPSAQQARPAVIDLSELSDDDLAGVDLIRLRANVALRYDPKTGALYLHQE